MGEYTNSQRPRSISTVIHHSIVASHIYFQGGEKPSKWKEVEESKVKGIKLPNASKTQDAKKDKPKEKGRKGGSKLSLMEMEHYWKEGNCFKCGEYGSMSQECP